MKARQARQDSRNFQRNFCKKMTINRMEIKLFTDLAMKPLPRLKCQLDASKLKIARYFCFLGFTLPLA
jgi:hypothetical protein